MRPASGAACGLKDRGLCTVLVRAAKNLGKELCSCLWCLAKSSVRKRTYETFWTYPEAAHPFQTEDQGPRNSAEGWICCAFLLLGGPRLKERIVSATIPAWKYKRSHRVSWAWSSILQTRHECSCRCGAQTRSPEESDDVDSERLTGIPDLDFIHGM